MHIPNGMLHGSICPVTALISTLGIGLAAFTVFFAKNKPGAAKFAAITALIFAGQMVNFPINGGTSGHLLGGVLAAALLGIPLGILSMAFVVTIQCLLFSDGGFTALGANIFNMSLLGAGLGGIFYSFLLKKSVSRALSLGISAWLSLMMAVLACSIELFLSGTIPFFKVINAMLSTHALIGLGEGLITLVAYSALTSLAVKTSVKHSVAIPLFASGIIAAIVSPFASGLPDGLEWVAAKYQFLHESAPTFVSPLPNYTMPMMNNEILTTGMAGLIGVIATFIIAWMSAKLLSIKNLQNIL